MTEAIPSRSPSHPLQAHPKAVATSAPSSRLAPAPQPSTGVQSTPVSRPGVYQHPSYYLSDRATESLIRRTLCPQVADKNAPISDLLPPLTSRNDVDLQLYAFIAIIIKQFVYTWYAKITPDQTFVEEVVKIIAHCTRGLEQRLRKVDLEALLFDELPELLDTHVRAYRIAYNPGHHDPLELEPRLIYHSLWPTPALSPVPAKNDPASVLIQKEHEAAYRQLLVEGVLAILLPTEDFENDCLTSLVGQIISEIILGKSLGEKACEPWVIWEGITKIAEVIQAKLPGSKAQERINKSVGNASCAEPSSADVTRNASLRWSLQKAFWIIIQYGFLAFTTVRFLIVTIGTSSSLPSRLPLNKKMPGTGPVVEGLQPLPPNITEWSGKEMGPIKNPMLTMKIWACASNLFDLDMRMPWLTATLLMLQWFAVYGPGRLGYTDGMIDKLLSQAVQTHVLSQLQQQQHDLLPTLLRTARSALFPLNSSAQRAQSDDTPAAAAVEDPQQLQLQQLLATRHLRTRRCCAEALLALLPAAVQEIYFAEPAERRGSTSTSTSTRSRAVQEIEQGVLDVFADPYCNRHLAYGVLELLIARLMPELVEKGVLELGQERRGVSVAVGVGVGVGVTQESKQVIL